MEQSTQRTFGNLAATLNLVSKPLQWVLGGLQIVLFLLLLLVYGVGLLAYEMFQSLPLYQSLLVTGLLLFPVTISIVRFRASKIRPAK
jgi:hypothetical protein